MSLHTQEAKDLWFKMNNYFFMCDDPQYSKLRSFRNQILKVKDSADMLALIYYFEKETGQTLNYFSSPF